VIDGDLFRKIVEKNSLREVGRPYDLAMTFDERLARTSKGKEANDGPSQKYG
jgi:hypothetical protein